MAKVPKWVLCLICGEIIYAGPSNFGMPRLCPPPCEATGVRPTSTQGHVIWDEAKYKAAGYDKPEIEYTEEFLDPALTQRPQPSESISDMYEHHMKTVPHDTTN